MHRQILTKEQIELLPLVKQFKKNFYMAGGTAIALYIGHRRSLDFDLFTNQEIRRGHIKNIIEKSGFSVDEIIYEAYDQLHIIVNNVKMTFFNFPYNIEYQVNFEKIIQIPLLADLAAMKAYALGGRAKWKDYVDLYFLLKDHFDLKTVSQRTKEIFGNYFNEKLFREQLSYFKDIDYHEAIEYVGNEVDDQEIKNFLTETAITPFI